MADDTNFTSSQGRPEGAGRGPRQGGGRDGGGGRDSGGFRIRLSDNEMQAARALQEAFNLRSTVAVLGFSLRTLAQLLEEGKLDEVVAQQRSQGGGRPAPRGERGDRRGDRDRSAGGGGGGGGRTARVDPFARPSRPAAAPEPEAVEDSAEAPAAGSDVSEVTAVDTAVPAEATPTELEHAASEAPAAEAGTAEATPAS